MRDSMLGSCNKFGMHLWKYITNELNSITMYISCNCNNHSFHMIPVYKSNSIDETKMWSSLSISLPAQRIMKLLIVVKEQEFCMEVAPKESVLELKQKVQHILNVPSTSQILSVCGLELMDGLDIEDYPTISHGTKVILTIKHFCYDQQIPISIVEQQCRKIQIIVKFSARKINIEVERSETVRSLKEKIHIIDGTPMKRMSIVFGGRELEEDYRYLSEYGVCEYSEIIVFLKNMCRMVADPPSRKLGIVVQTSSSLMNGARIPLEMNDLNTLSELREILLGRKILPMDDYIFIHKQRLMKDNCSLRWHGVENGDHLYVFKGTVG